MLFDIVVPVGPNDYDQLNKWITYNSENILNYRNIYVVTSSHVNIIDNNYKVTIIDENIFPFNIESVAGILGKNDRNGWYLQQLIKLYAGSVIPGILNDYLVVDTDTFFLKKTLFYENGIPLYNYGREYHKEYFNHMIRLHPTLTKQTNVSGICHHMLFQTKVITELFKLITDHHNGKEFWIVFLESVDKNSILKSGASEYEIYFNFLHIYKKEHFKVRQLLWRNCPFIINHLNLDYVSCHHYIRK